jgi:TonB family protein
MGKPSIPNWLVVVPLLCFACKSDATESATCDAEQLGATTTKIAQLPPSERGRAAWDGLKAACGSAMPQAFVAHYDANDPGKPERLQNPAQENSELEPLIRKACPDWDTLRAVLNDAPPDQRGLASFGACAAERYEVVQVHQAEAFGSTEVTWALHQWLLDHGVQRELATGITHGMLAYERELSSPLRELAGLTLPVAIGSPLHAGVAVYVSLQEIRMNGESVVKLDGKGNAAVDALRNSPLAAAFTAAKPADVLVAADAQVPFATMLDLLDVAREAGRNSYELAVTTPDQGLTLFTIKTPLRAKLGYYPAMSVELTSDGQTSARSAAALEPVAIARDDRDAFLQVAKTVKKYYHPADTVMISASPEVPLQQVVDVIAAVRGGSCEYSGCVLPFATLSRTPAHEYDLAGLDKFGNLIVSDPDALEARTLEELAKERAQGTTEAAVSSKVELGKAKAKIAGKLDGEIIFRILRAHLAEVRTCHEKGLKTKPSLAGRVDIHFVIDGKGKVASAEVEDNTLGDSVVANCIVKAVKRWTFPKPPGGEDVSVTYPFELSVE